MVSTPAALIGLTGVVFLAGSFVPAAFNIASLAQSPGLLVQAAAGQGGASPKGDRMAEPLPADSRAPVSTVELVGLTHATIILRDRDGKVLYRSDPRFGITTYSKNTDLPVITLKEDVRGPVVQHPQTNREGTEMPQDQKPKRRNPVGCMGDVSPLAKAGADRTSSLCLAQLGQSLS